ncbi:MAG: hypothetical protein H7Y04_08845 [Verrucomicrobia bacterium]|nr:hypothetical protein [Cytophagales bacterium]
MNRVLANKIFQQRSEKDAQKHRKGNKKVFIAIKKGITDVEMPFLMVYFLNSNSPMIAR